jgi:hypothetical protein
VRTLLSEAAVMLTRYKRQRKLKNWGQRGRNLPWRAIISMTYGWAMSPEKPPEDTKGTFTGCGRGGLSERKAR